MPTLGVNIDHIATVRQARRAPEPDPVWGAVLAELGGADCITCHLREDRRHINDRDVELLRKTARVKLNLEMSLVPEIVASFDVESGSAAADLARFVGQLVAAGCAREVPA